MILIWGIQVTVDLLHSLPAHSLESLVQSALTMVGAPATGWGDAAMWTPLWVKWVAYLTNI
ncbi:hypothetical protein OG767_04260 [Micromonospora sp. NBC_01392]|uniref:hypothetical protein n=1 Tax=Micromonospora sp. NBC_01392 TaxID=2903588 RepID=UPI003249F966